MAEGLCRSKILAVVFYLLCPLTSPSGSGGGGGTGRKAVELPASVLAAYGGSAYGGPAI